MREGSKEGEGGFQGRGGRDFLPLEHMILKVDTESGEGRVRVLRDNVIQNPPSDQFRINF